MKYFSYCCSFISKRKLTDLPLTYENIFTCGHCNLAVLLILVSSSSFFNTEFILAVPENTVTKIRFLTYCDPIYGVKIQYPSNWTIDEKETLLYDGVTKIVGFIKNPNAMAGDFLISVYNLTNNASQTIGLEELLNNTIDYYKEYYYDFNLIESNKSLDLANSPNSAYILVWIDSEGQYTIKTMQVGTIIGNRVYVVQYYAEFGEYSNNLPLIETMIDSLNINNNISALRSC